MSGRHSDFETTVISRNAGRPRAIPTRLIPELLQQREAGKSWEELAQWLRNTCAVDCSRWAVRRACLGLGVYELCHNCNDQARRGNCRSDHTERR